MPNSVLIEVEIIRFTPGAIIITDGHIQTPLPKNQIEEKEPYSFKVGDIVEMHIPKWLAKDRNLI